MQCGSALAPVIQYITNLVYQLMKAIQSVVYALTGVNIFANANAKAYTSMASSAKDTAKSSKQTSNHLADIDEIHNIQKDSGSGSGSGGGTGGASPSFDLSNVENLDSSILDAIKNGNWYEIGKTVGNKLSNALEKIPWNEIQEKARNIATNIADLINGFVDGTKWEVVGSTIGNGINTALIFANTFFKRTNFQKIGSSIAKTLNSEIRTQDWKLTGETISNGINSAIDIAYGFVKDFDWANFGTSIGDGIDTAIQNIEWEKLADTLWTGIKGICTTVKNLFFTAAKTTAINNITNDIAKFLGLDLSEEQMSEWRTKFSEAYDNFFIKGDWGVLKESIKTLGKNVIKGFFKGMLDEFKDVKNWIKEHIFTPIVGGFKDLFGIHSPSTVFAELGENIIQGLYNGIQGIINNIVTIFTDLKEKIVSKFQEIKDKVVTKVTNTVEGVKNNFSTMKDKVVNTVGSLKEKATTKFNEIKDKVTTKVADTVESVKTKFGEMREKVVTTVGGLKEKVTTKFTDLAQSAKTWGKDLVDNMANGIKKNVKKVTDAASSVAGKIKGFLGFSEPDVGPLSNFHTYMPDMIDLMVEGIHNNIKRVTDELEILTGNMSYTINTDSISNIPTIKYNSEDLQTQPIKGDALYESVKRALKDNNNTGNNNNGTINFENKLVVNGKVFAREIIEDLDAEARRRGYKPILQH